MRHLFASKVGLVRATAIVVLSLLVGIGGSLTGHSAALADVPNPPAAAPFNAPLCEGAPTAQNPAEATGAVPDLTLVFGQRLIDYNNGQIVVLYDDGGGQGSGSSVACAVRYVEGAGAVSEWMYCTDMESKTCSETSSTGELMHDTTVIGGLEYHSENARLSPDQSRIIAYILQHDMPVTRWTAPFDSLTASNATEDARTARQLLVWCISDTASAKAAPWGAFCDANIDATVQQGILAKTPAAAALTFAVDAASTGLEVGDTARINVTTNLFNRPIALVMTGAGTLTLCGGAATLVGTELTVAGTDASSPATVTLCIVATAPGTVSLAGSGTPANQEQISWAQSPGAPPGIVCQVFATFETTRAAAVSGNADVVFSAVAAVGGFSIAKQLAGDGTSLVPTGTTFTVNYTVDGGATQTLSLVAGGAASTVSALPAGATIALTEAARPPFAGVVWGTPVFTVNGTPVTSIVIGTNTVVAVVLTNTATTAQPAPSEPTTPPLPGLADTGTTFEGGPLGLGALLLVAGAVLMLARRRQHARG